MRMSQILPNYAFTKMQILLDYLSIYLLAKCGNPYDPDFC